MSEAISKDDTDTFVWTPVASKTDEIEFSITAKFSPKITLKAINMSNAMVSDQPLELVGEKSLV